MAAVEAKLMLESGACYSAQFACKGKVSPDAGSVDVACESSHPEIRRTRDDRIVDARGL